MATPPDVPPELPRDDQLARALEEVLLRQTKGEALDLDALGRQHPDLIDELRQLLAVGQVLDFAQGADPLRTEPHTPALDVPQLPRMQEDYELIEELGRGGMGVVYKAWDRRLKRFVALKMILRGRSASAADLGRFRSEAQAAAGLTHPNIVPVYQVGEHEGQAYFCMKYVPGQTLAQLVATGPLPQRQAATYLAAVARAVQHAHDRGILHRDRKPANVLLDENDQPLVTDFGLAKRVEGDPSLTGTGAILGTPSYMAPEQTQPDAHTPGAAADIYSLGAVLYELLTGRPPFLAASAVETLLLVRSEEPVRPSLLNPQIDLDLELICRKCLEKQPRHRYSSAGALADDLDAYLAGEPVSARSSSFVYFVSRLWRETHHAPVLEHWGALWMWHSLALFGLCLTTSALYTLGVQDPYTYPLLWSVGLVVWGAIFWNLRKRGGPVTFVERQIAHAWGAGVTASIGMFMVEVILGLKVLTLSPILAIVAGMVFLVKAGTLSGWFYLPALLEFCAAPVMAWLDPAWGLVLFGFVSGLGFFVPGLKYYRQRLRAGH
jgi:eukaryotic-like serine/threonine-protein kinase